MDPIRYHRDRTKNSNGTTKAMGEFAIGQAIPREEDPRLLTGGGNFLDDVNLNRQAWGYVLRSPHPHATIVSINTEAAKKAPGVVAVLTGEDWMAEGYGTLPCEENRKKRDGSPMFHPYRGALATGRVRFVGDYVAFVVAETRLQARDAAELIDIEYDPLPAISGIADAIAPGAEAIWPDNPDNFCFTHAEGDLDAVEAAFAKADHVVTRDLVVNRVAATTMEPRGCIGDYDRHTGRYTAALRCLARPRARSTRDRRDPSERPLRDGRRLTAVRRHDADQGAVALATAIERLHPGAPLVAGAGVWHDPARTWRRPNREFPSAGPHAQGHRP